ncbi:Target of rapamycin complex 2 subunit [Venturia nashicola]|uniref:Target of rapamycin complex 2 subunit n=1 Tax=Venturia nashicola TaxID=86259 RepID=A0A4Z1PNP5_9PEZI|nr:Target of rapamycin complex 2 subunit [Venturia nashicola]TLD37628.1 Target of rapamycin complex 2 subunit [Venturia nashicola]
MPAKGEASEFNAIIQAEREKKKNQLLADKIFGSGKRSTLSGPGNGNGRKAPTGPATLASRAGITKPSAGSKSNAGSNGARYPTSFKQVVTKGGRVGNQQRAVSTPQLNRRNQILTNAITGGGNAPHNLRNQIRPESPALGMRKEAPRMQGGINIRGMGETPSRYTIIAQNFATGTTAADIESVLSPNPIEDGLIHCRLIASNPTVIAELIFSKLSTADLVIATFNNKKADGRLLHVYLQNPTPDVRRGRAAPTSAPAPVKSLDSEMMDVEETRAYEDRRRAQEKAYTPPRGDRARAQPAIQDGRFGFSDNTRSNEASYQEDGRQPQYGRRGGARGGSDGGGDRHDGGLVSDYMIASARADRYVPSQYPRGGRNYRR